MVVLTSEHCAVFLQPGGAQTLTDFHVKWSLWHEEVDHCLQDSSFSSNKHLEVICKVSHCFCLWSLTWPWPWQVHSLHCRSWLAMKKLCWSTRSCWAPGTTSWSRDCSFVTQQSNLPSCISTLRYTEHINTTVWPHWGLPSYCCCSSNRCSFAVLHDHVSGVQECPRAPGQHLTRCLWVRHPSSPQGLQVSHRSTVPYLPGYLPSNSFTLFTFQHCTQQLVVCGAFNRSVGSLQTPAVPQSTVRTEFAGSCTWIHLSLDLLCFICCLSALTMAFCGVCMKLWIKPARVSSVGICIWSLYSSQVWRSLTFTPSQLMPRLLM